MSVTVLAITVGVLKPLALLPAVAGVALLVRGLRGERSGGEPRCPRCRQGLSSLEGKHCPKCGLLLLPEDIVYGAPRRRRAVLAASLLLGASVAGWCYWVARLGGE